jgi:hypothetical protein
VAGDPGGIDLAVWPAKPADPAVQVQDRYVARKAAEEAGDDEMAEVPLLQGRRLAPVRRPARSRDRVLADGVVVGCRVDELPVGPGQAQ